MSLVSTQNLTIGYGEKKLAGNISVELHRGQLVGLIGQNGVGKSTLLRTMAGLQPRLSGKLFLDSRPLEQLTPKEIAKKLSIVLTGKPDILNLTVIELVTLGRYPYSGWLGLLRAMDKQKIEEAITQMEINYIAGKRLFELSDGQLQKALIARALAQDTDIILLDEPTSHLDLRNKIEVLNLLKKIAENQKAVLISTHEVQQATHFCDEFWCMDFGKKMLVGNPKTLVQSGGLQEYLHVRNDDIR